MTPCEMYNFIKNSEFKTVGNDVNYKVYVSHEEKRVYLVFQESTSQADWKVNLDWPIKVIKRQTVNIYVHRGFANTYNEVKNIIQEEFIDAVKENCYVPVIIGWSYGGAMAQLAGEDFYLRSHIKPEVVTFGSPKIFYTKKSAKYIKSCCKSIYQYTQINDFVTWCVPFIGKAVNVIRCGEKFNFLKLLKTSYYHTHYDLYV